MYDTASDETGSPRLERVLGFWALTIYGVGDILGAGIYALVGKVAGLAGPLTWLSFVCALGVAALTAGAYAELGARFPKSGGEAFFCEQAFHRPEPALLVGWLVFWSGIVSMATVSHAFAGYMSELTPSAIRNVWIVAFIAALCAINFWGIRLTSTANAVCTAVEAGGLLLLVMLGGLFLMTRGAAPPPAADAAGPDWLQVGQGAALSFFAFIGFEDMSKVSEEVRSPRRNIPLALFAALSLAGLMYVLVAVVATAVVPPGELAASAAPLNAVVRRAAPWLPVWTFSIIALFAVANTALLNCVMASRLLYGMSDQRLLPRVLGRIHSRRHTPHVAIAVIFVATLGLAASGTLQYLAETTSVLLLAVFLAVHVALLRIKYCQRDPIRGFRVPAAIPIVGAASCVLLATFVSGRTLVTATALALVGLAIVAVRSWLLRAARS